MVAFILRQTLGWLATDGNPIQQNISVPYSDLIAKAGISRGAARKAIDEAVAAGFIRSTQQGRVSAEGQTAKAASFMLCWDDRPEYVRDAAAFGGFYAGEGHRTPIPNAFFDRLVPNETLAVVKVVGAVLRHTVGYANQFGGRRSEAPLAYSYIQKYTNLRHRPTLADAIRAAIEQGYIRCVSKGCFDPRGGKASRPARYAVNWLERVKSSACSPKTEPGAERSNTRTRSGSKTEPADQSKNRTKEKTQEKDTYKQQDENTVAAVKNDDAFRLLIDSGFDELTATMLSERWEVEKIRQQIAWLKFRNPGTTRTA